MTSSTVRAYLAHRRNTVALLLLPGILGSVFSSLFAPASFWLSWLSLAALCA